MALTSTFVLQSSARSEPAMKLHGHLALPKLSADIVEVLVCLKRKQRRDRPRALDGEMIALQCKVCGFVDVVCVVLHMQIAGYEVTAECAYRLKLESRA